MRKDTVSLVWRDQRGQIQRVLEVSRGKGCPVCRSWLRKRADTHGMVCDSDYVPIECQRCLPGTYYAIPIAAATELRSVKELRRAVGMVEEVVTRPWWERARDAARAALTEWRSP